MNRAWALLVLASCSVDDVVGTLGLASSAELCAAPVVLDGPLEIGAGETARDAAAHEVAGLLRVDVRRPAHEPRHLRVRDQRPQGQGVRLGERAQPQARRADDQIAIGGGRGGGCGGSW